MGHPEPTLCLAATGRFTLRWECLWIAALGRVPREVMRLLGPQGALPDLLGPTRLLPESFLLLAPFSSYLPISSTYWLLRGGPKGLLRVEPDV